MCFIKKLSRNARSAAEEEDLSGDERRRGPQSSNTLHAMSGRHSKIGAHSFKMNKNDLII
jgi:hypothetical protein